MNQVIDKRTVLLSALAMALACVAAGVARALVALIAIVTNLCFFGTLSAAPSAPADHQLGLWVVLVPVGGGLVVGLLARFGSKAIRGHGIPEAMEQVLLNRSRIPARMTVLKPLSAAIAIGSGGPFGAEGPIIATGGALGSLLGQVLMVTPEERKTLLAAGAAAGMAATFGSPVAAVLLAVELLLFEYRAQSLIPVALASAVAAALRIAAVGAAPMFQVPNLDPTSFEALCSYVVIGAVIGVFSVAVTRAVYAIEDAFERLPIAWPWWPALGGLAVGLAGVTAPLVFGVGYTNIEQIVGGTLTGKVLVGLIAMKFIAWSIALGSGTSGGTLAPLFTIGAGLGSVLGAGAAWLLPHGGIDPRMAALVGMAALFAGAARALLASVVFAFETTLQPTALLPLLAGCTAAYLVSSLVMRHTIMTEKLARRGLRVPVAYAADSLSQITVAEHATRNVVTLLGTDTLGAVREWFGLRTSDAHHQGYPVLDHAGDVLGLVTQRDLFDAKRAADETVAQVIQRPPVVILLSASLREAADQMARHQIGRLIVVLPHAPRQLVGLLTRSDLVAAHATGLSHTVREQATVAWPRRRLSRKAA